MVIVGEFVGGAVLGAAFGVLFDVVKDAVEKSNKFNPFLKNIKSTLDSLKPVMDKIADHNKELGLPDEEIEELKLKMVAGIKLINKLSKVSNWSCMKPFNYADELVELDESLKRMLETLKAQGVRDVKETLVLVKKHTHQLDECEKKLDECERDGKQTLDWASRATDQLDECKIDVKETLVLAHKINDQLDVCGRDAKETSDLARNILKILSDSRGLLALANDGVRESNLLYAVTTPLRLLSDQAEEILSSKLIPESVTAVVKRIKSLLDPVPRLFGMRRAVLDYALPLGEVNKFRVEMEEGVQLIRKCSNVRTWTSYKMEKYTDKLLDLEKSLQAFTLRLKENLTQTWSTWSMSLEESNAISSLHASSYPIHVN